MKLPPVSAALILVSLSAVALAATPRLVLVNNTGNDIRELNISASRNDRWGPNILGDATLERGQRAELDFAPDETECLWDIRVTFVRGGQRSWTGLDLCELEQVDLR